MTFVAVVFTYLKSFGFHRGDRRQVHVLTLKHSTKLVDVPDVQLEASICQRIHSASMSLPESVKYYPNFRRTSLQDVDTPSAAVRRTLEAGALGDR